MDMAQGLISKWKFTMVKSSILLKQYENDTASSICLHFLAVEFNKFEKWLI